ncbi:MAG TPA: HDIG domain-containing protein [Gemmatimonadota bacterium]|nr:HDIG domain-containing protein [Gemmatimonadota bacterium]
MRASRSGAGAGRGLLDRLAAWRPSDDPTSPRDLALRFALVSAVALVTIALFPPRGGIDVPLIRQGVVAPDDVIAPMDFPVLRSEDELARQREVAALSVPPVYRVDSAAPDSALARIQRYLARAARVAEEEPSALATLDRLDAGRVGLGADEIDRLARAETRAALSELAEHAVPGLYERGHFLGPGELTPLSATRITVQRAGEEEEIIPKNEVVPVRAGAEVPGLAAAARGLDPEDERLALLLLPALLAPDLEPRPAVTELRRAEARASVEPVKGEVLRGELIVPAHTRVTAAQEEKMRSLAAALDTGEGLSPADARVGLGTFFINAVILCLFGFFLFLYHPTVFADYRSLAVLAIVWALVTGLAAFAERAPDVPSYAVPVAFASVLAAILWGTRMSAVLTLFLCVYLIAQGELGFPLLWAGLASGLVGAWSVRLIRRRTHFYESLVFIAAANMLALGGLALVQLWTWSEVGVALAWGFGSAATAVFLAMGLLPLLEWAAGRTTDLTLLELADLNRPLLKQLLVEAPGTYHHSIIVGNLAESAAEGIGANSLLARVGAYYHDIGKLRRPEFFAENQRQGENPHDSLTPQASARIISRHVEDGVEMGRRAGLPEVVLDVLREHHGTTRLSFFWHKASEELPAERPMLSDFVYPGPRPRSKETAVVMLADSVEAASRVMREPSAEALRLLVKRIVEMKLEENQFDEADLTFHDLAVVQERLVGVLVGIHHHRIDYPTLSLHVPERSDDAADTVPSVGRSPA